MVLNYDKSKEECFDMLMQTNSYLRKMETCGKPVVCHKRFSLAADAK
jgi:hypothetical protein